jgi:hypothetical protein
VLALIAAAVAFTAGRMTRPEAPAEPATPRLARPNVDVSLPALAVSESVPALKEKAVEAPPTSGQAPTQPAPSSSPSTGGAPSSGGGGGSTGGSSPPVVVGGGTE